jgi:peptidoglycan/LPS O-acetylase OafA/YrhL
MYWLAHVVSLVSPFQARPESIDYRFLLSFLGDRVWPLDMIFYYFNPALWYFGLLLQLYLVFPLLFRLLQRAGVGGFLVVAAAATFGCRYVLLCVWPVNGNYVQGAFFLPRLWEFAFGMALGWLYRKDTARADSRLFSLATLAAAGVVYLVGLECYGNLRAYTFADALTGTGLTIILAHVAKGTERIGALGRALATVGAYSYGLYLLHQPYVLYFSALAKPLPTAGFLAAMWTLIALLAIVSMAIERRVNALTQRIVG